MMLMKMMEVVIRTMMFIFMSVLQEASAQVGASCWETTLRNVRLINIFVLMKKMDGQTDRVTSNKIHNMQY